MDRAKPDVAGLAIAAILLVLAVLTGWDPGSGQLSTTYGVGPKAMPYIVASGLAVLAICNGVLAWRGGFPPRDDFDARGIAMVLAGFVALIAIIGLGGGFILATAILFTATATAFGRRALHIDLPIGLALGAAAFLLFDKLLALSLPAGPIERLF